MGNKILLTIALLSAGCVARPKIVATPEQKAEAISLYMKGASASDIGNYYGIGKDGGRELIRSTIRDLYRKYSSDR